MSGDRGSVGFGSRPVLPPAYREGPNDLLFDPLKDCPPRSLRSWPNMDRDRDFVLHALGAPNGADSGRSGAFGEGEREAQSQARGGPDSPSYADRALSGTRRGVDERSRDTMMRRLSELRESWMDGAVLCKEPAHDMHNANVWFEGGGDTTDGVTESYVSGTANLSTRPFVDPSIQSEAWKERTGQMCQEAIAMGLEGTFRKSRVQEGRDSGDVPPPKKSRRVPKPAAPATSGPTFKFRAVDEDHLTSREVWSKPLSELDAFSCYPRNTNYKARSEEAFRDVEKPLSRIHRRAVARASERRGDEKKASDVEEVVVALEDIISAVQRNVEFPVYETPWEEFVDNTAGVVRDRMLLTIPFGKKTCCVVLLMSKRDVSVPRKVYQRISEAEGKYRMGAMQQAPGSRREGGREYVWRGYMYLPLLVRP